MLRQSIQMPIVSTHGGAETWLAFHNASPYPLLLYWIDAEGSLQNIVHDRVIR
jgi:hypothetical protein